MSRDESLWTQTAPDTREWPALDRAITADVVVIGGGFTGVSAAYHLASAGASVALIEARQIGFGGSGRNVGLVNAGLWTPPDQVEGKLGRDTGVQLNGLLAGGPDLVFDLIERHQIQCEATRQGTLHCAHSASGLADLKARFDQQTRRGAPVRLLDAEETRTRTGSDAFHGALWDARAGTIQPLAFVQGLARAADAQGAQIYESSGATAIREDATGWHVTTPNGSVRARRLIQATNAYGTAAAHDNSVIPAHFFQCATAPLPSTLRDTILPGGEGCWDTAKVMSSFRCDQAGRLIFGALGNLDGAGSAVHHNWARRKLARLFPQLADVPFETAWTGRIAMTGTYLPRIERRGRAGISIFGYSGRGIGPGTVFGKAAADWALDRGALPLPITDPHSEPLRRSKAFGYEAGATLFHTISDRI